MAMLAPLFMCAMFVLFIQVSLIHMQTLIRKLGTTLYISTGMFRIGHIRIFGVGLKLAYN